MSTYENRGAQSGWFRSVGVQVTPDPVRQISLGVGRREFTVREEVTSTSPAPYRPGTDHTDGDGDTRREGGTVDGQGEEREPLDPRTVWVRGKGSGTHRRARGRGEASGYSSVEGILVTVREGDGLPDRLNKTKTLPKPPDSTNHPDPSLTNTTVPVGEKGLSTTAET